jgi:hypothetical protein
MAEIRQGTAVSNRDGSTLMTDWIDDWFAATDHAYTTHKSYKAIINPHQARTSEARPSARST